MVGGAGGSDGVVLVGGRRVLDVLFRAVAFVGAAFRAVVLLGVVFRAAAVFLAGADLPVLTSPALRGRGAFAGGAFLVGVLLEAFSAFRGGGAAAASRSPPELESARVVSPPRMTTVVVSTSAVPRSAVQPTISVVPSTPSAAARTTRCFLALRTARLRFRPPLRGCRVSRPGLTRCGRFSSLVATSPRWTFLVCCRTRTFFPRIFLTCPLTDVRPVAKTFTCPSLSLSPCPSSVLGVPSPHVRRTGHPTSFSISHQRDAGRTP